MNTGATNMQQPPSQGSPNPYSQPGQPSTPFSQPVPPQTPNYNTGDPSGQLWQSTPYGQSERPSMPFPQQPMQPQPNYNPAMAGNAWPQQQMYQQPMQPQPVMQAPVAVNINMGAQKQTNGCVRAIYFVFVGWWLSLFCLELGFLLCAFIITLPVGLIILNRIPQIMTLKPPTQKTETSISMTTGVGGATTVNVNVSVTGPKQYPFIIRALYYIFIGCWVGYIWATIAYFFCLSILGLPLGILMLNLLPTVLTLRKN